MSQQIILLSLHRLVAVAMVSFTPLFFQEVEAEEEKEEPTEFTIKLIKFDAANKVKLIKEIKNIVPGLNLVQVCGHVVLFVIT